MKHIVKQCDKYNLCYIENLYEVLLYIMVLQKTNTMLRN